MAATPYLSADALRSVKPLDNKSRFPDADLNALVAEFEEIVEQAKGVAFTPRDATYTCPGVRGCRLELPHRMVTDWTSVSIDGTALSAGQLAKIVLDGNAGTLHYPGGWLGDVIEVDYTHGLAVPPAAVLRACKEYVRARALKQSGNQPRDAAGPAGVDGTSYPVAATTPTGVRAADSVLANVRDYLISVG